MVSAIYPYVYGGIQMLEVGLAHPTFLGRMVSWGAFYGVAYFCAKKVYDYVTPKFRDFMQGHCWCTCHKEETPKGETVLADPVERKQTSPKRKPNPSPVDMEPKSLTPATQNPAEKPQEAVKKK